MKRGLLLLFWGLLFTSGVSAQPYFDLFSATGWHLPKNLPDVPAEEQYFNFAIAVPVKINTGNLILVRSYYEQRELLYDQAADNSNVSLYGIGIPVTWLLTTPDTVLKHAFTFIGRSNATEFRVDGTSFQFAAAYLLTYKVNQKLSLQAGAYYSREFFSDFYLPLAGIDWQISERVNFFGVFPNAMRLEFRVTDRFYTGAEFKSVLNSYRSAKPGNAYFKVADNHLGLFAEYVLAKKLVVYGAAGASFLRRVKSRNFGADTYPEITGEDYYLKFGTYVRFRTR